VVLYVVLSVPDPELARATRVAIAAQIGMLVALVILLQIGACTVHFT
jgi:hypothetical protein